MIKLDLKLNGAEVAKRVLHELGGKKLQAVIADASNRAAAGARTDGKRLIKQGWGLPVGEVASYIKLNRASQDGEGASAVFTSGQFPLQRFKPKPSAPMGGRTEGGVKVNLAGRSVNLKHAFIARMKSGHLGVFARKLGEPRAINEQFTIGVAQMAADKKHEEAIKEKIQAGMAERFEKRFRQQIDRFLKGK